ncbi:MAG: O-methyltransferase [Peptoniphilaceae bacterium]|uniref:O-methyltransferase n=1 Tax=Parvimonas sp. TaxID=1944660 RepID=UPI0025E15020|nr:O-methyltransferase [Parvimonas sp.]MCI5997630.1 O-methyltransferase [Parvimonas sp.]MDD7765322.1 O-methyltransferase [Peptoniphilaceae bacterium]MDY3051241.1 O-methyltransferase [Parvimonas sp.]
MEIVAGYVSEYIRNLEKSKDPILLEMEFYAQQNAVPIIEVEVARFLEFLVMLKKPKRILEIGTAIGYSALIMNKAYPKCKITTIEIDEKNFLKAKEFVRLAGCEKNIDIIYADANDALDFISKKYDMIFMDAAKGQYISFFEKSIEKLNKDGILVSDNILFRGLVAKEKNDIRRKSTIVRRLREFLTMITNDEKFTTTIVPIDDGMAISYKKY